MINFNPFTYYGQYKTIMENGHITEYEREKFD